MTLVIGDDVIDHGIDAFDSANKIVIYLTEPVSSHKPIAMRSATRILALVVFSAHPLLWRAWPRNNFQVN